MFLLYIVRIKYTIECRYLSQYIFATKSVLHMVDIRSIYISSRRYLLRIIDVKKWTNVQDQPVLTMGPEEYDKFAVAMNQVVKYKGLYYGYYHASAYKDWHEWSTNVAVSRDLIHWKKYPGNPIVGNNKSSGILVHDGKQYRLYTMHPEVNVYFPITDSAR